MNVYGVIMAGGGGTRFWPLSRNKNPKQLLNLSGKDVMINETAKRLKAVCGNSDIYAVTGSSHAEKTIELTKGEIPEQNVLIEPCARNTSACIGYAAVKILATRGDGVMVVTPSDAYIKDEKEYARVLKLAAEVAEKGENIVTLGIKPTFPATGYGYINYVGGGEVKDVLRFVEKPSEEVAKEYLREGGYVWNSGVFVFTASLIMEKFKTYLPEAYEKLMLLYAAIKRGEEEKEKAEIYPAIPAVSIDYGIMEKSDGVKVIPSEFGWSDVGSWDMMDVLNPKDENGNVIVGQAVTVDCKDCVIYSDKRIITAADVEGLVIVETADAIMVCRKDRAQDVKKIVDILKNEGKGNLV